MRTYRRPDKSQHDQGNLTLNTAWERRLEDGFVPAVERLGTLEE